MEKKLKVFIHREIDKTVALMNVVRQNAEIIEKIEEIVHRVCHAFRSGNKVLLAGNGGSAADAQHIAGEFVSRFMYNRPGLPAFALTTDTSVITAIGNDYGYDKVFARQIQAVGVKGDIFWCYSTSGKSPNILLAMQEAREKGLTVIGFTGQSGWKESALCDISVEVPSMETPKIQECHGILGHIVCGLVEAEIFPRP